MHKLSLLILGLLFAPLFSYANITSVDYFPDYTENPQVVFNTSGFVQSAIKFQFDDIGDWDSLNLVYYSDDACSIDTYSFSLLTETSYDLVGGDSSYMESVYWDEITNPDTVRCFRFELRDGTLSNDLNYVLASGTDLIIFSSAEDLLPVLSADMTSYTLGAGVGVFIFFFSALSAIYIFKHFIS